LTPQTFERSFALFVLAAAASSAAWFLMRHYNQRMTRARQDATHLVRMFKKNGIKFDELVGHDSEQAYAAGEAYDREELITFGAILAVAPLLVFVRYLIEKIL
jgi:GH35 family endo-1,4-beta-xylanase